MVEAGHYKELESVLLRLEMSNKQDSENLLLKGAVHTDGAECAPPRSPRSASTLPRHARTPHHRSSAPLCTAPHSVLRRTFDAARAAYEADAGAEDIPMGEGAGGAASHRQTFLFSATLMLPPAAREINAKRLKRHQAVKPDSTMDKLLRTVKFQNAMKVIDLTRSQLVATKLTQRKISCLQVQSSLSLSLSHTRARAVVLSIACGRFAAPSLPLRSTRLPLAD